MGYFKYMKLMQDLYEVLSSYRNIFGCYPNLISPKTFNEKIARRKIFDRDPIHKILCDKILVKGYVEKKLGPGFTPGTLGVYRSGDDFFQDDISTKCVLKTSLGWDDVCVLDPQCLDKTKVAAKIDYMIDVRHGERTNEWGYYDQENVAFTEEFVGGGKFPVDYKMFCFHGRVEMVKIYKDRHVGDMKRIIVDRQMDKMNFEYGKVDPDESPGIERGAFGELVEIAERLSGGIDFVRVDMYSVGGRPYVGELTLYPAAGRRKFNPASWDEYFGAKW